jgi:hypothetical protein
MRLEIVNAADRNSLNLYKKCTVFLLENKTNGNAETKSDWTQSPKKNQPTVFTSEVKQKLCHIPINK